MVFINQMSIIEIYGILFVLFLFSVYILLNIITIKRNRFSDPKRTHIFIIANTVFVTFLIICFLGYLKFISTL